MEPYLLPPMKPCSKFASFLHHVPLLFMRKEFIPNPGPDKSFRVISDPDPAFKLYFKRQILIEHNKVAVRLIKLI
jgi:hypothetical protein